jgi:hypothetical protein
MPTPDAFTENGYYEIVATTTDLAGNTVTGSPYKVIIRKHADNTIRVYNINDRGSGVKDLYINVYEADVGGSQTSIKAIDEIHVENPYNDYKTTVSLGSGKYYVEVKLVDNAGLETIKLKPIENDY